MARESVDTKNINGVLYYTSTYFAKKVFVNKRDARGFLEDFSSLEGHTNPRLYDQKTIEKAIDSYKNGYRTKDIYNKKRLKLLVEQEIKRASIEEKNYYSYLENYDPVSENEELINDIGFQMEVIALNSAKNKFEANLTKMMLKHVLYIQGYEFDEKQYLDDLVLNEVQEIVRDEGEVRALDHINALKRLNSLNAYLKKV